MNLAHVEAERNTKDVAELLNRTFLTRVTYLTKPRITFIATLKGLLREAF